MALEEYKKESDRLEFLYRQKNDLVEAQDTLLETIQVINKTAHERFTSVFNQIRANFRQNFEDFFEGGEGDLRIRFDPDDPLAANIMILARPRGKQLGALELLSAGEKALTAITLLFSIYQVKPSPFCILDEVDAPLDDVNVRRFLRVLHNFAAGVQFIIVTHNKLTMEAADFIYGVTMAEEGISKIVSVELNQSSDNLALDN
jgi:chromosome segregation protein